MKQINYLFIVTFLLLILIASVNAVIIVNAPTMYFNLNETSSTRFNDSTSNGYYMNSTGTVTAATLGILNNSISISANGYTELRNTTYDTTAFTINMWINPVTIAGYLSVYGSVNGTFYTHEIFTTQNGDGKLFYSYPTLIGTSLGNCFTNIAIPINTWSMITIVFYNSSNSEFYYNGSSRYNCSAMGYSFGNVTFIKQIGTSSNGVNKFNGKIDEYGYWANISLNASAIKSLYNNGSGLNYINFTTNTTTLINYSIYFISPTPINNTNQYYSNSSLSIFFNVSPDINNFTDYYRTIRLTYNGTPNDYTCFGIYCLNYIFYNLSVGNYSYYVKGVLNNGTEVYTETRLFNIYNLNLNQSNITSNCNINYTKDVHNINYTTINISWTNVTNATYYTLLSINNILCNTTNFNCSIDTRNLSIGNNYLYINSTNGLDYSISNTTICNINVCINNYQITLQPCTNYLHLIQYYDANNCNIQYDFPYSLNNTYENCTIPQTQGETKIVEGLANLTNAIYTIALTIMILIGIFLNKNKVKK
jgi:hypothetical protein